jgi:hypothetical protein
VVSPDGNWLYVNETFGRRLSRFPIHTGGSLGPKEVVTTFGKGTFPDGLTFDAEGHVWITSIVSNRVIRVAPDGAQHVVLEEVDARHLDWCEEAYLACAMTRAHVDNAATRVLRNTRASPSVVPTCTAYLGASRRLGRVLPLAGRGHPPMHWHCVMPARTHRPQCAARAPRRPAQLARRRRL